METETPRDSPVLPALNEISIQRVVLLVRILSRLASRLSFDIEPSSRAVISIRHTTRTGTIWRESNPGKIS